MSYTVVIQTSDFDIQAQYDGLRADAQNAGAIVFFVGLVRDLVDESGSALDYMQLEHYPEMTESLIMEIVDQARVRFQIDACRVVHRVGKLSAHDQIVFVACAARHRVNAFHAAEFIMDYLKTRATLWKKEVSGGEAKWLGLADKDKLAVQKW